MAQASPVLGVDILTNLGRVATAMNASLTETIENRVEIPPDFAGLRLDKAAALLLPEHSRAELTRWINEGALTLDGSRVRPRTRVLGGETLALGAQVEQREAWQAAQYIDFDVLFEDQDVLIINKPAGLVVHPGAGNASGTLVNGLLHYRPGLGALPRAGIVHRLDKETSGIMVVAASAQAHRELTAAIAERRIDRRYVAVCEGVMVAGQDIDQPIGRDAKLRTRQAVRDDGKPALTRIRVGDRFRRHTLVRAQLGSGRTHQIRVHMQSIGHPLVGDRQYGWRRIIPPGAESTTKTAIQGFGRQALHAARLSFEHPVSGQVMDYTAPMPKDLSHLIDILSADAAAI